MQKTEVFLDLVHAYRTDTKGRPLRKRVSESLYKKFIKVIYEGQVYDKAGWLIAPKSVVVETPAEALPKIAPKPAKKAQPAQQPDDFDPNIPELQ